MSQHLFDNRSDERRVLTWLQHHLADGAQLSVASAYFTVNAFALLRPQLESLGAMRFLFGEPRFLKNLDPGRSPAAFTITDGGLRMALVDLAGSNQENILAARGTEDEATKARDIIASDLGFRDRQLLRLRDETPDIEELDGGVTLSDFTLDDFIADLMVFLEAKRGELERSPLGMFAVVPPASGTNTPPGIVWCLRRRGPAPARQKTGRGGVARFAPYYLIYVKDDGSVALSFNEDKRLLSTLRALCRGRHQPWEAGCRAFDAATRQGEDMSEVVRLLEAATHEIAGAVRTGSARALAQGGKLDATTVQINDSLDGWDLVSWFVVQAAPVAIVVNTQSGTRSRKRIGWSVTAIT